jgi:hypothetical protein
MVQHSSSRISSRDGVNTARLFFEHHACRFQEIDQQQDIGKDVYVDLADKAGITPLCVALQIKSGVSYRFRRLSSFGEVPSLCPQSGLAPWQEKLPRDRQCFLEEK